MLLPSQIAIPSGIDDSLFATAKQLFKQLSSLDKQINGGRELCKPPEMQHIYSTVIRADLNIAIILH